jgi:Paraquat-inducible protein A
MHNDLDISLSLYRANAIVQALMQMTEERLFSFPLQDLLNLNCWLATMQAPELDARGVKTKGSISSLALANVTVSLSELKPNITCTSCTSPGMYEIAELISAPEAIEDITEIANRMLDSITKLMGGTFLQLQLDRLLNDAARKCPHSPLYEVNPKETDYEPLVGDPKDPSIAYLVTMGLVVLAVIFAVAILVAVIRCSVRRRHQNWVQTLPNHQVFLILGQQDREYELEVELNSTTESMFQSSDIPSLVRWLMPIVIVANIAFFLSGHLSLGATVDIKGEFAGEEIHFEKFFEFSMAQSVVDIWKAGAKELAFLLLIVSGVWPYTKQILSLALWFLPPTVLPVSKRGSIFLWLDWLAKWSMLDVFVLVVTIAAFR